MLRFFPHYQVSAFLTSGSENSRVGSFTVF
jgi:hypothetical protein